MRSVTYSMAVSLDGYVVGPDDSFDWTAPDEEVFRAVARACSRSSTAPGCPSLSGSGIQVPTSSSRSCARSATLSATPMGWHSPIPPNRRPMVADKAADVFDRTISFLNPMHRLINAAGSACPPETSSQEGTR